MPPGNDRRRLLLTGATGFIGRLAVEVAVARGFDVHAICRHVPPSPKPGVTYHATDLLGGEDIDRRIALRIRASHLLHLAWCVVPGTFWGSPENYQWVGATLDLAAAFVAGGGARIVGVGTGFEYQASDDDCGEESTPLDPLTPYAGAQRTRRGAS